MVPWELEALLHELGWVVMDGWGSFSASGNGTPNGFISDDERLSALPESLQQAISTFWVTIAAVPVPEMTNEAGSHGGS
jgi:hypothetical protein